jgi:hypothetical protein
MIGKFGSDQQQLADLGGGVISEDGATLLSGESTGEASLLAGPALLREVQALVANGDFAIPPADAEATITANNALPYWTFTDVNSAGAITCALVADATAGSGKVLRWSVAASTTTGKSATLARYVPVASSRNRAFAHIPELNTASATNTANASVTITYQYYKLDYTTTGSSGTSTATFATLGTGTNWMNPAVSTTAATPSDAAFIYVEIKVSTTGTTPASISTVDITEARVIRGDQTNLFAEYTTPGTYAPTRVRQVNGVLNIEPNGGTGNVTLGGDLTVSGGDLNLSTTHVIAPLNTGTVQFTRNDTGNRSNITVGRVFPGDQTTRYIDDDGTYMTTSGAWSTGGGIRTAGSVQNNNGSYYADTPATTSGTGQIANSAQWTLSSGTNWQLRRSTGTSWAKFKDNIEASSLTPEQFKALQLVQFDWNEEALREQFPDLDHVSTEKQHGVILDQLQDVMPEAIQPPTSPQETETVAWHVIHMAAMVALQDAIARIEVLEAKVAELEGA